MALDTKMIRKLQASLKKELWTGGTTDAEKCEAVDEVFDKLIIKLMIEEGETPEETPKQNEGILKLSEAEQFIGKYYSDPAEFIIRIGILIKEARTLRGTVKSMAKSYNELAEKYNQLSFKYDKLTAGKGRKL